MFTGDENSMSVLTTPRVGGLVVAPRRGLLGSRALIASVRWRGPSRPFRGRGSYRCFTGGLDDRDVTGNDFIELINGVGRAEAKLAQVHSAPGGCTSWAAVIGLYHWLLNRASNRSVSRLKLVMEPEAREVCRLPLGREAVQ
ncbi:hypothetical protein ACLOJK_027409 [Asimina triloba]